ncbi:unnamed protein product [Macrosiphum euphorbiae]|uniref:Uncharacterized protein n=1 Tax=Macrosiphum euphorbiae TaxID=13131 RepID=A0AAV0XPN5_9HEMI|nr:unnamed protein product [Macrosiphum euphorbiae]
MRSRSRVTGGTTTTTIALAPASGDDDDADDDHHRDHDHYHDHDHHHQQHHNHRGRDGPSYRIIIQRPAADETPSTGRRPDDCDIDGHGRGGDELLNYDHEGRRRSSRTRGYTGSTKIFDVSVLYFIRILCKYLLLGRAIEKFKKTSAIRYNEITSPIRLTVMSIRFIFTHYG